MAAQAPACLVVVTVRAQAGECYGGAGVAGGFVPDGKESAAMGEKEAPHLLPVSDEEYEQLAAFRYALRRFLSFSEGAAREAGVTPQQYVALVTVRGFPGRRQVTISELAERLKIRHHSAVGLVNRLVSQGLLVRTPSTGDRRQVFATLTPRGAELLDRLAAAHRDQLRRIGPELTAALERLAHS